MIIGQALYASVPTYQLGLTLTKISLLLQYWRVFVGTNIRRPIIIMAVVTILYGMRPPPTQHPLLFPFHGPLTKLPLGIWSICSTLFMCAPIAFFWNPALQGKCLNRHAIWFSNAAMNILTDFVIFILPMPVLRELHLPRRQKCALIGVFALGAFVVLTSVLRLKSLYTISVSRDVTWDNGGAAAWSSVELNVGIICASLPTLRKTISKFFPAAFSASEAYVYYGSASGSKNRKSGLRRWPEASETGGPSMISETGKNTTVIEMLPQGGVQTELVQGKIRVMTVTTQEIFVQEPEPAMLRRPQGPPRDESFLYDGDARQI